VADTKVNLKRVANELKRKFGDSTVEIQKDTEWVKINKDFDDALGGGLPRGRLVEIYGKESAGKSTVVMAAFAKKFLKMGEHVVWIDYENSYTQGYADMLGLKDPGDGRLLVLKPHSLEEGADMMNRIMGKVPKGLYVIDSLAAGMPQANLEPKSLKPKDMTDTKATPGRFSAACSAMLRAIIDPLAQHQASMIVINQVRSTFSSGFTASGETTPGGNALKFLASQRLRVKRKKIVKAIAKGQSIQINLVELRVMKTKLSLTEGWARDIWVIPCHGVSSVGAFEYEVDKGKD